MAQNVIPRKGAVSAPTSAPDPHPFTFGPTGMSAPAEAPTVRSTIPPRRNGDAMTPQVRENQVDPVAPKRGSKDPTIERTV